MSTQQTIRNAFKAIMTYEIGGVLTKICGTKKDFGAKMSTFARKTLAF